jgi:hypothetical protein
LGSTDNEETPVTEPTTRSDDEHAGIDNATEKVVENWQDATERKDPSATTGDFERMRDGFQQVGEDGSLGDAAERGTEADRNNPA